MQRESSTIYIDNMKEMRSLINKIKNIGLANNGIIYGGLVRDEIIATHYRHKFICKIFNGFIVKKDVVERNDFNYINTPFNIIHSKIKIIIYIGQTINFRGVKLIFNIDVVNPDNSNNDINNQEFESLVSTFEPPFNHLDFLCNIFIIERINGRDIIRISNNTGTPIDTMPFTMKNQFTTKIINDMLEHKTQFVRHIEGNYNVEYINIYRILKMIDRQFYWNITNIPIKILNTEDIQELEVQDNICSICIENFDKEKDNKIVSVNVNKSNNNLLHYNCFIEYMYAEQKKRYRNPQTGFIECRCPYRNPFNFKDCYLNVDYCI